MLQPFQSFNPRGRQLGKPHQRGLAALYAAGGRLLELDDLRLDDADPPDVIAAADKLRQGTSYPRTIDQVRGSAEKAE